MKDKLMATPSRRQGHLHQPTPSSARRINSINELIASASKLKVILDKTKANSDPPQFEILRRAVNDRTATRDDDVAQQDPFVGDLVEGKMIKAPKLSPTAIPFAPRPIIVDLTEGTDRVHATPGAASLASSNTLKETPRTIVVSEGIFDYIYPTGEFASGRHTRYLKIEGISPHLSVNAIKHLIKGKTHGAPELIIDSQRHQGIVFVNFDSIVDSVNAAGEIPNNHKEFATDFATAKEFYEQVSPGSGYFTSIHKGQLIVVGVHHATREEFSHQDLLECMIGLVKNYGAILALEVVRSEYPGITLHMEYYNIKHADTAKLCLNGRNFGDLEMSVKDYTPDVEADPESIKIVEENLNSMIELLNAETSFIPSLPMFKPVAKPTVSFVDTPRSSGYSTATKGVVTARTLPMSAGRIDTGPTPYTPAFPATSGYGYINTPILSSFPYSPVTQIPMSAHTAEFRPRHVGRVNRLNRPQLSGGNNVVNVYKIQQGQDVRTTIMLRNIPNKMAQAELKQIIDETNFGEYDFMYLRIDFANNCNVGYAFVNFVDPFAIVKFVNARAGAKWSEMTKSLKTMSDGNRSRHISEKVAEISYATIQGRDCLIQKFRNSSVMLEDPSFRPKLFHSGTGPKAGSEEIFPGPDNDSKLRRSIENAGAVGLFAPRAGQVFRHNQRHRPSQWDRGTQMAQLEESALAVRSAPPYRRHF